MRTRTKGPFGLGICAVSLLIAGCASTIQNVVAPAEPRFGPSRLTYDEIESRMRGAADSYVFGMAEAYDRLMARTESEQIETTALGLKAGATQAAIIVATGANPVANFMDLASTATLRRQALESYWVPNYLGEVGEPLIEDARRQEQIVWNGLAEILSEEQLAELESLIEEWRAEHPDDWHTGGSGMRSLRISRSEVSSSRRGGTSVFSLLLLDPLAGLDPAAQEVELSRRFADRVMFALQRQPMLLSWQAEYLLATAGTRSTGHAVLRSIENASSSMERFADFLDTVPDELDAQRVATAEALTAERLAAVEQVREAVGAERAAAMEDFFGRLAEERAAILEEMAAQEGAIVAVSTDLRETISAGTALSESLRGTAAALESLVARFESEEPSGEPGPSAQEIREMMELGRDAIDRLGGLAESVERIVASPELTQRIDESDALAGAIDARLRGVVDHAFGRAIWLLVIAIGAWLVGALTLRLVPRRGAG